LACEIKSPRGMGAVSGPHPRKALAEIGSGTGVKLLKSARELEQGRGRTTCVKKDWHDIVGMGKNWWRKGLHLWGYTRENRVVFRWGLKALRADAREGKRVGWTFRRAPRKEQAHIRGDSEERQFAKA